MTCWQCGRSIELKPGEAVSRRESCPQCDTDLHSCRNCRHYDPNAHNQCREVQAEWVRSKDRNNYCDYFDPSGGGAGRGASATGPSPEDARSRFDDLFRK